MKEVLTHMFFCLFSFFKVVFNYDYCVPTSFLMTTSSIFVPISIILIHNLYKEKQLVLEEISDLLLQKMCMKQLNGTLN